MTVKVQKRRVKKWIQKLDPEGWLFVTHINGEIRVDKRSAKIHICDACDYAGVKSVYKLYHPALECDPKNIYVGLDCAAFLCGYDDDTVRFKRDLRSQLKQLVGQIEYAEGLQQTLRTEAATVSDRIERARSELQRQRASEAWLDSETLRTAAEADSIEAEARGVADEIGRFTAIQSPEVSGIEQAIADVEGTISLRRSAFEELSGRSLDTRLAIYASQGETTRDERSAGDVSAEIVRIGNTIRTVKRIAAGLVSVLNKPLNLVGQWPTKNGRVGGVPYYIQHPRSSSPFYYWVKKSPPKNVRSDFYKADLRASNPDGEADSEAAAICAIRELMKEALLDEAFWS